MQVLALVSIYARAVIVILAVVAVVFSFFWVFLPLPRGMSKQLGGSAENNKSVDRREAPE
jgi:hypothetical protein